MAGLGLGYLLGAPLLAAAGVGAASVVLSESPILANLPAWNANPDLVLVKFIALVVGAILNVSADAALDHASLEKAFGYSGLGHAIGMFQLFGKAAMGAWLATDRAGDVVVPMAADAFMTSLTPVLISSFFNDETAAAHMRTIALVIPAVEMAATELALPSASVRALLNKIRAVFALPHPVAAQAGPREAAEGKDDLSDNERIFLRLRGDLTELHLLVKALRRDVAELRREGGRADDAGAQPPPAYEAAGLAPAAQEQQSDIGLRHRRRKK